MTPLRFLRTALLAAVLWSSARAEDGAPFALSASLARTDAGAPALAVHLTPAPGHYVYAESISAAWPEGGELPLARSDPPPERKRDPFLDQETEILASPTTFFFDLPDTLDPESIQAVDFSYQGCNQTLCFLPETVRLAVGHQAATPPAPPAPSPGKTSPETPPRAEPLPWRILASASGYHEADSFLAFLDEASGTAANRERPDRLRALFDRGAYWLLILLILAGGLALNLTPCVLPMIPVNLAVIGAGSRGGAPRRGFALGSVYGLGMAVAYGLLGFLVVFAGAQFGAVNASWGFNLAIAAVFVVLGLAMFDVFTIDFSRWQIGGSGRAHGSVLLAFGFGALSAVLAGACVAPVVISVLLLSASLYSGGSVIGLLLPFLLGAGMALPWPFAGAGLSVLPKPGRWMNRVKGFFGVLILLMALYYGLQAARLGAQAWQSRHAERSDIAGEMQKLSEAAARARAQNKPLLVDFWATWCKNCLAMERTTFREESVRKKIESDFVFVKVQAERPADPQTRELLQAFEVIGLPTYVVLAPPETAPTP